MEYRPTYRYYGQVMNGFGAANVMNTPIWLSPRSKHWVRITSTCHFVQLQFFHFSKKEKRLSLWQCACSPREQIWQELNFHIGSMTALYLTLDSGLHQSDWNGILTKTIIVPDASVTFINIPFISVLFCKCSLDVKRQFICKQRFGLSTPHIQLCDRHKSKTRYVTDFHPNFLFEKIIKKISIFRTNKDKNNCCYFGNSIIVRIW